MTRAISGATLVAGVAGSPVTHSLSPLIHNAWLDAAAVDGVYVAFPLPADGFTAFAQGLPGQPLPEGSLNPAYDPSLARRAILRDCNVRNVLRHPCHRYRHRNLTPISIARQISCALPVGTLDGKIAW